MEVSFWGESFKVNLVIGCIGGFLIAVLGSMFGFGGGPFMAPLLTVGLGLPMYLVVGSSLLAIFFNTVMGSMRHVQFGHFDLILFCAMLPGALLAGFLGPKIAKGLSPLMVKRIAVFGLMILGLRLLF